jgi:CheY-like chemotaxis protein
MILQTLLLSKDDLSAETLTQVLAEFGVAVSRSNLVDDAVAQLAGARFDQVIVDFDEPAAASLLLDACRGLRGPDRNPPVTVALLNDASQVRSILGAGAHFILNRPITHAQAQNTFHAAIALLKRERQQSARVAVQAPVSIRLEQNNTLEGILLDLSNYGMDLLAAQPLPLAAHVHVSFALPDDGLAIEADAAVAWSNANGQAALRFLEMDANLRGQMGEWLAARSRDAAAEEPDAISQCKLTDLSLGGCYVQTESPFPQSSAVDLCLRVAGMDVYAEGLVRVMHPGHGMGIEFPAHTAAQRAIVTEFIQFLIGQPGVSPQLETSPRSLVASAASLSAPTDAPDPLLELLRNGNALDEDAFLAELQRQRTAAVS